MFKKKDDVNEADIENLYSVDPSKSSDSSSFC